MPDPTPTADTWQQRATLAESRLAAIEGEAAMLRRALTNIHDTLDPIPRHEYDPLEYLVKTARAALVATPHAAKLGALVEAAVRRVKSRRAFESVQRHFVELHQTAYTVEGDRLITPIWEETVRADAALNAAVDALLGERGGEDG